MKAPVSLEELPSPLVMESQEPTSEDSQAHPSVRLANRSVQQQPGLVQPLAVRLVQDLGRQWERWLDQQSEPTWEDPEELQMVQAATRSVQQETRWEDSAARPLVPQQQPEPRSEYSVAQVSGSLAIPSVPLANRSVPQVTRR